METLKKIGRAGSIAAAAIVAMLAMGFGTARADVLNLSLAIPQADSVVYGFGDQVTARLVISDENGDTLRADQFHDNSLTLIELWVSGPRQDYHGVTGYTPLVILDGDNGFNQNSGFDPATGEIGIRIGQNIAGTGSYTVLFKCQRQVGNTISKYVQADFQVGQARRTRTPLLGWFNCAVCHDRVDYHATNEMANCVVCHAKDSDRPFQAIIHNIGVHQMVVEHCAGCHKANAEIANYKRTACFSCHDENNAPAGHADHADGTCVGCHEDGVYNYHQERAPSAPVAFDLISPADGDTFAFVEDSLCEVPFNWHASHDNDADDRVLYALEIATNRDFGQPMVFDSLTQTSRTVRLEWNREYWWRVRAEDLNTGGTLGNGEWRFVTWGEHLPPPPENNPPSHFALVSPHNNGMQFVIDDGWAINFRWESSTDPDSGAIVKYLFTMVCSIPNWDPWHPIDTAIVISDLADTSLTYDFNELNAVRDLFPNLLFNWNVKAISQGDTTDCDATFSFNLQVESGVRPEDGPIPNHLSLYSPHPNPFNSSTTISYALPGPGRVRLEVFDVRGRPVEVLEEGERSAGYHEAVWQAGRMQSGIYLVRLDAGGRTEVKKVVMVK